MVPRLHAQLLPPLVYAEDHTLVSSDALAIRVPAEVRTALRARGHNVTSEKVIGITQFISVDPETGVVSAVSDPRKDGRPAATVALPVNTGTGFFPPFFTFF
jgi:gamma-glutamyltranspeptidase